MTLYKICVVLHITALSLWLGHMFVWSLIVGPAMKRIEPADTAAMLRERSLFMGGLGWPALAVLVPTGLYMLSRRGITPSMLLSGDAFAGVAGTILAVKLCGVLAMIIYQAAIGHRSGALAIYFNMLVAFIVIAASVVMTRGWI